MKNMKKWIVPGWGVPPDLYSDFADEGDEICSFGFFRKERKNTEEDFTLSNVPENSQPELIIAHSMGALSLLRSLRNFSNLKALILIGAFAKFAESSDNLKGQSVDFIDRMLKNLYRRPETVLMQFYRMMCFPEKRKIDIPGELNTERLIEGLKYLKKLDVREKISEIHIPVLALHGKKDKIVAPELAEELIENLQNSKLIIFENIGHSLPYAENPGIKKRIEEFLNDD